MALTSATYFAGDWKKSTGCRLLAQYDIFRGSLENCSEPLGVAASSPPNLGEGNVCVAIHSDHLLGSQKRMSEDNNQLIDLSAMVVAAYVAHNNVTRADLPELIAKTHAALAGLVACPLKSGPP